MGRSKPISLPTSVIEAIVKAVEAQGGDIHDVEDLVQTWERLHTTTQPRVDAIKREAREQHHLADNREAP